MDRKEIQSVGDVLRMAIADDNLEGRLNEIKAAAAWPSIVGRHIADQTMKPYVRNGAMTIRVPDAGLRQELSMTRSAIIREFNRIVGCEVITSLRFTS